MKKFRFLIYLSILVGAFTLYSFGINDVKTPASFDKYVPVKTVVITLDNQELYELHNIERSKAGLKPLKVNSLLEQAAESKIDDMILNDYFAHYSPSGKRGLSFISDKYKWKGENLADHYPTETDLMDAWMNSESHRNNILSSHYSEIGIAVKERLVVVMFGGYK